jgi:hypothetical protein
MAMSFVTLIMDAIIVALAKYGAGIQGVNLPK